jgi:hypothetical protein
MVDTQIKWIVPIKRISKEEFKKIYPDKTGLDDNRKYIISTDGLSERGR